METVDQHIRQEVIARMSAGTIDASLVVRMDSVDRANTARMKLLVEQYGWPGRSLVGDDGAEAAFLQVQHADLDTGFQIRCLSLVRDAYKAGEVSGQSLALLTDRVRVHQGRPQLYGSQVKIVKGEVVVDPIEDEANVDRRRAGLGLPPMSEYLKLPREMYRPGER